MSKNKKPTLMILATAVVVAGVGIFLLVQQDPSQQEPTASFKNISKKESMESKSESEESREQNQSAISVGESFETSSGLKYKILEMGEGSSPVEQSQVKVHYRGRLEDGTEFDSSYKRGQPATFPVNGVIRGWTEALMLMKPGDKWELTIPPELGYGSRAVGNVIPPNSTLIFEVELLEIL